jgi:hypothetical protein
MVGAVLLSGENGGMCAQSECKIAGEVAASTIKTVCELCR